MLEYLNQIHSADIPGMSQESLERFLPLLGINNEELQEVPQELLPYCGKGLKFWQYPNQFSKYLKHLMNYKDIRSYLEIGCRWGGTFIITSEVLKMNNPNMNLYACDIIDMSQQLHSYASQQKFTYLLKDSNTLSIEDFNSSMDLILIDGLHTYEAVTRDFEIGLTLNPKYVVFHDVYSDACPGVVRFWNQIKDKYKNYEFIEQYQGVKGNFLGIGLIELS